MIRIWISYSAKYRNCVGMLKKIELSYRYRAEFNRVVDGDTLDVPHRPWLLHQDKGADKA